MKQPGVIYLNSLPESTTEDALLRFSSGFGLVLALHLEVDALGTQTGSAQVTFAEQEHAQQMDRFCKAHSMVSDLQPIAVDQNETCRSPGSNGSANLYLCHFPKSWTESDLALAFPHFCTILSVRILREQDNPALALPVGMRGKSRGIGFCRVASRQEAETAVSLMNGLKFPGYKQPLQVRFADTGTQKLVKFNGVQCLSNLVLKSAGVNDQVHHGHSQQFYPFAPIQLCTDKIKEQASKPLPPRPIGSVSPLACSKCLRHKEEVSLPIKFDRKFQRILAEHKDYNWIVGRSHFSPLL